MRWLAVSAALGAVAVHGASTLDKFKADSTVTYCKTAQTLATVVSEGLSTTSAGACPVVITLTVSANAYTTFVTTDYDVAWSTAANGNWSPALFPAESLASTFTVANTSVIACRVDSTCSKTEDVLYPVEWSKDQALPQLNVAAQTAAPLANYRFRLPGSGEYFIIGDVVLPSTSAGFVHNYVFQRVRTSSDAAFQPGKVIPGPATGDSTTTRGSSSVTASTELSTDDQQKNDDDKDDASEKKEQKVKASSLTNPSTSLELPIFIAVGVVAVMAVVAVARYRSRSQNEETTSVDFSKSEDLDGDSIGPAAAPPPVRPQGRPPLARSNTGPVYMNASRRQPIAFGFFGRSSSLSDTGSAAANKGYNTNPSGL